jgi:hypothetical protein
VPAADLRLLYGGLGTADLIAAKQLLDDLGDASIQ